MMARQRCSPPGPPAWAKKWLARRFGSEVRHELFRPQFAGNFQHRQHVIELAAHGGDGVFRVTRGQRFDQAFLGQPLEVQT